MEDTGPDDEEGVSPTCTSVPAQENSDSARRTPRHVCASSGTDEEEGMCVCMSDKCLVHLKRRFRGEHDEDKKGTSGRFKFGGRTERVFTGMS